jgi:hypothetical protein
MREMRVMLIIGNRLERRVYGGIGSDISSSTLMNEMKWIAYLLITFQLFPNFEEQFRKYLLTQWFSIHPNPLSNSAKMR